MLLSVDLHTDLMKDINTYNLKILKCFAYCLVTFCLPLGTFLVFSVLCHRFICWNGQ